MWHLCLITILCMSERFTHDSILRRLVATHHFNRKDRRLNMLKTHRIYKAKAINSTYLLKITLINTKQAPYYHLKYHQSQNKQKTSTRLAGKIAKGPFSQNADDKTILINEQNKSTNQTIIASGTARWHPHVSPLHRPDPPPVDLVLERPLYISALGTE